MPLSAVDAFAPALENTKLQLLRPFRAGQWAKLALVGFLAGELNSGGGCNSGFHIPRHTSDKFLAYPLPTLNPAVYAALIATLIVSGALLWLLLIYVNSMMRFVLFDSVVQKECHIRRSWSGHLRSGWRYFLWQLGFALAAISAFAILIGVPAAIAMLLGWLQDPHHHMVPLILGGIVLFFAFLAFLLAFLIVHVLTKDFVIPQMALEDIGAMEGWSRLWPMLKSEKGGYAGYIGMKVVLAIVAGVLVGIVAFVVILLMLIPVGGFGAIAILAGKTAGLTWNLYTITVAAVVGCVLVLALLYVLSLISVPAIVFFPAYSIYFFAARYPRLQALLHSAAQIPPVIPSPPIQTNLPEFGE